MRKRKIMVSLVFIAMHLSLNAQDTIGISQINEAERLLDLHFSQDKKDSMVSGLTSHLHTYEYLHQASLDNHDPSPLSFDPVLPGMQFKTLQTKINWDIPENVVMPKNEKDLAFYSILELASLIKHRKISSVQLTRFFLERLQKYGDSLHCVISLTPEIALDQARKADEALANGIYKGPLQGIPYGIKDLFSVRGTQTTWGTPPYKKQTTSGSAFVAEQLEKAGAILVAKLSLGELAMDDVWFGGQTRNPWDMRRGSGGSSAGSASATAAGLVPFAIGTETYGSIVEPSALCGVTGLRPSFGSVARTGAMTLAYSSDKIGPICHTALDAAIVFQAIHGNDQSDQSSRNMPFNFTGKINIQLLKIAYCRNYIDSLPMNSPEKIVLDILKKLGAKLTPIDFPEDLHADEILSFIIAVESASSFDQLTRSGQDDLMVQQNKDRWPNIFRTARFAPAVEYLNACRMRYKIMQKVQPILGKYDIIIAPPLVGEQLAVTNLTGQPSITLPIGLNRQGMPASISFIGNLYDEATLLSFAVLFQHATTFHHLHPPLFIK